MTLRSAAIAFCLTPAWLLAGADARAGTNDVLIGLDQKTTYDANGQTNARPGRTRCLSWMSRIPQSRGSAPTCR